MRKKHKLTEEQKLLVPLVIMGVVCVIVALLIAIIQGTPIADYAAVAWEVGWKLLAAGMVCLGMVLIAGLVGLVAYFVDWDAVIRAAKRVGGDISNSILTKNSKTISYRLQYFLFGVLSRNNQVLRLPLGDDFGCLSSRELIFGCRDKCVIYHFDLILPQQPDIDVGNLRSIIQSLIETELNNYGIVALNSCFHSKAMNRNYWSIYLDRLTYIEPQHRLSFEVLYICSEESAKYLVKAIQRDTRNVRPQVEVFDDELQ